MVITVRTALGANGSAFPLQGNQYEFLTFPAKLEFAIQADATGVLATVYSGSDLLMQEGPVQLGTINVQPKYPDDYFLQDVGDVQDRINVILRDTSGVARTVMTTVIITPLG